MYIADECPCRGERQQKYHVEYYCIYFYSFLTGSGSARNACCFSFRRAVVGGFRVEAEEDGSVGSLQKGAIHAGSSRGISGTQARCSPGTGKKEVGLMTARSGDLMILTDDCIAEKRARAGG